MNFGDFFEDSSSIPSSRALFRGEAMGPGAGSPVGFGNGKCVEFLSPFLCEFFNLLGLLSFGRECGGEEAGGGGMYSLGGAGGGEDGGEHGS